MKVKDIAFKIKNQIKSLPDQDAFVFSLPDVNYLGTLCGNHQDATPSIVSSPHIHRNGHRFGADNLSGRDETPSQHGMKSPCLQSW